MKEQTFWRSGLQFMGKNPNLKFLLLISMLTPYNIWEVNSTPSSRTTFESKESPVPTSFPLVSPLNLGSLESRSSGSRLSRSVEFVLILTTSITICIERTLFLQLHVSAGIPGHQPRCLSLFSNLNPKNACLSTLLWSSRQSQSIPLS